jgi:hypothetical protein
MKRVAVSCLLIALTAGSAAAQIGGGLSRPPDPIDQARQRAMAPVPKLPPPQAPSERWVPERRVYSPEFQREVVVPGHYERRITDQQYSVPPQIIYGPRGENPIAIPGGQRPPADQRQGP